MIEFRKIREKSELVDALTGVALRADACECDHCGVFYNQSSVDALVAENNGDCVSCNYPFPAVKSQKP